MDPQDIANATLFAAVIAAVVSLVTPAVTHVMAIRLERRAAARADREAALGLLERLHGLARALPATHFLVSQCRIAASANRILITAGKPAQADVIEDIRRLAHGGDAARREVNALERELSETLAGLRIAYSFSPDMQTYATMLHQRWDFVGSLGAPQDAKSARTWYRENVEQAQTNIDGAIRAPLENLAKALDNLENSKPEEVQVRTGAKTHGVLWSPRSKAVWSAISFWGASWAYHNVDGTRSAVAVWAAAFLVAMGTGLMAAVVFPKHRDRGAVLICILGPLLSLLLIVVALKHPDGYLEVQAGILASLLVALAASSPAPDAP